MRHGIFLTKIVDDFLATGITLLYLISFFTCTPNVNESTTMFLVHNNGIMAVDKT